jgi:hypothetical protein
MNRKIFSMKGGMEQFCRRTQTPSMVFLFSCESWKSIVV